MLRDRSGATWCLHRAPAHIRTHEYQPGHFLSLAVECLIGGAVPKRCMAFVDTGAQWSVVSLEIAQECEADIEDTGESITLSSRFGRHAGRLCRVPLSFIGYEGATIDFSLTAFIPDRHWPGPAVVLGMQTGLELLRFAVEPCTDASDESWFYFGLAG